MEDSMILDMYFERDEAAIDATRRKYGKRMFRTSKNILYNSEDAEECVNDTLMKAWQVIPPTRPAMFGAFLAKIARNLAINKWESRSAAKRGGGETNVLLDELADCLPADGTPEQAYEAKAISQAITSFLDGIDRAARVAFALRYFHGESIKAISERFGMSESKIKSMLFRTRKKLKTHLEKEGVVL